MTPILLRTLFVFLCVLTALTLLKEYVSVNRLSIQVRNKFPIFQILSHSHDLFKNQTKTKRPDNTFYWVVGTTFSRSVLHRTNSALPMIFVITPTYRRMEQLPELIRLSQTLKHVPALHWIVVEDAVSFSKPVQSLLRRAGLNYTHMIAPKPVHYNGEQKKGKRKSFPRGVSNRNAALTWVRRHVKNGVLYFADDDNSYDIRLFEEMRWTKKVSMWPVGLLKYYGVSSPVVSEGRVVGFYDSWVGGRKFPVDMAGFAVNINLILKNPHAVLPFSVGYEEDRFLRHLHFPISDIEPKASNCTEILVWHTKTVKNKKPDKMSNAFIKKYSGTNIFQLVISIW